MGQMDEAFPAEETTADYLDLRLLTSQSNPISEKYQQIFQPTLLEPSSHCGNKREGPGPTVPTCVNDARQKNDLFNLLTVMGGRYKGMVDSGVLYVGNTQAGFGLRFEVDENLYQTPRSNEAIL
ncbi:predicted protein [Histoplasma capsulatum G186AR]|uniref:Uncharacterized protein n=1 Tax=Ajellomyces capsulatus (strain G186AR / H82 / ATCC MYA-2454 / RMSCC 2432) TaxID=447093 RepID=C0NR16_AJECG|nr:uncharacterized protein HCBG_05446 [Histoplasma capsulatum G186AR]EEH06130.1 predicted protein [Histoplasma capsulatum G186AR]